MGCSSALAESEVHALSNLGMSVFTSVFSGGVIIRITQLKESLYAA